MKGTITKRGKGTKLTRININGKTYELPRQAVRKFRAAMGVPKRRPERTLTRSQYTSHGYRWED